MKIPDIHNTPFNHQFRLTRAIDLKAQVNVTASYGRLMGQINGTQYNISGYESIHTQDLFSWLCESGIPEENIIRNRRFYPGSNKMVYNYWCVWLSAKCYIFSWEHKIFLAHTPDLDKTSLNMMKQIIEEHFTIKNFKNYLFLHYDAYMYEDITKLLPLTQSAVDLNLHFNDDILAFTEELSARLEDPESKGFVLLAGPPGTGKSHYIRHLINQVKNRFMVFNPWHARNFTIESCEFITDYQQYIFILEDLDDHITGADMHPDFFAGFLLYILQGKKTELLKRPHIITMNRELKPRERDLIKMNSQCLGYYGFGTLEDSKAKNLAASIGCELPKKDPYTLGNIFRMKIEA